MKLLAKDPRLRVVQDLVGSLRTLKAELPIQHAAVLLAVAARPGITQSDLVVTLGFTQSGVSRAIHALADEHWRGVPGLGLVRQQPDHHDSRLLRNYPTERGVTYLQGLVAAIAPDVPERGARDQPVSLQPQFTVTTTVDV